MLATNDIYCLDVLEGLGQLKDNSIDLAITSPPYNLGNNHHTGTKLHSSYKDAMPENEYQEWQIKVIQEIFRVLKDDGSFFYNHKNRIKDGKQISPYEWLFKTDFIIKQEIVWINRSQNFDKIRFYPFTERIYWLTKLKTTKLNNIIKHSDVFNWQEWRPVGTNVNHTRQFPEKMVTDILQCFPDKSIVLDPFMGYGTTAVACKALGREYIGFELDEQFCQDAKERVAALDENFAVAAN
ncbi:MAG: site-specific DNA-methyltransferase [Candidatus Portiera sp.]|nr:site-specific DNA-methyltransferase [Portiera sp.]